MENFDYVVHGAHIFAYVDVNEMRKVVFVHPEYDYQLDPPTM